MRRTACTYLLGLAKTATAGKLHLFYGTPKRSLPLEYTWDWYSKYDAVAKSTGSRTDLSRQPDSPNTRGASDRSKRFAIFEKSLEMFET